MSRLKRVLDIFKFKLPRIKSKDRKQREKLLKDYEEGKILEFYDLEKNKGGK